MVSNSFVFGVLALLLVATSAHPVQQQEQQELAPYTAEALKQEVLNLPGQPASYTARHFSGYIPVRGGKRQLFFWFFESQRSPATDPLVFWTSGGPGCSGIGGAFTENGPFRNTESGDLELNDYGTSALDSREDVG